MSLSFSSLDVIEISSGQLYGILKLSSCSLCHVVSGNADFKILLAHRPSVATEVVIASFDLQLSGHTHSGGQTFPISLIYKLLFPYVHGLYWRNEMAI